MPDQPEPADEQPVPILDRWRDDEPEFVIIKAPKPKEQDNA